MSCCPEHKTNSNQPAHDMKHDSGQKMDHSAHKHHETSSMTHGGGEAAADFLRRFFIVTFLLVPLVLLTKTALDFLGVGDFSLRRYVQFMVATIIFYFSIIFFEHAKHEIKSKKYGMMTLVSLAVGAGYLFSAASTFIPAFAGVEFYLEISTLIWVLLFGHYLEAKSTAAAGDALTEVAKLLPKKAHLIKGDKIEDVDVGELKKNDLVLIRPGEKVPADGVIVKGKASLDQSLISGESKPVEKKEKDQLVAGSVCLDGSLTVKIERVGEATTIGQIKRLIAQAQQTKPTAQKIADKAASVLTITALVVALATILVWSLLVGKPLVFGLTLAITVLVIACPHALGLAIPTVSTIATSLAVKNGIFIKDLAKLEVVKEIDYVVFDKTGTLTKGEFGVTDIINLTTRGSHSKDEKPTAEKEILQIAASLEQHSSHMIGLSIVKYAKSRGVKFFKAEDFKNVAGKGILGRISGESYFIGNRALVEENQLWSAKVQKEYERLSLAAKTAVFVGNQRQVVGIVALSDVIKNESSSAIKNLHQIGIKVAMLTGDNRKVAETVAKKLNIDSYFWEVLPQDKYKYIRQLQDKGSKVLMAGDGVNDAPALTQANVGVAIGAGTDVAVEAGDMVLTRNNPEDIVRLIVLAKKVYRKIVENLVWATGYNVIAIPAAAGVFASFGFFLKPEVGAILMSLSSVIVVINALALKKVKLEVYY